MDIFADRPPLDYRDWGKIIREIHAKGVPLTILSYHLDLSVAYLSRLKEGKIQKGRMPQLKYPQAKRLLEIYEEACGG